MALDTKTKELIRRYIVMSEEDLAAVPLLLESGFYRAAINRSYYACYHMVSGALLSQGVHSKFVRKKNLNFIFRTIFTFDNNLLEKEYILLYENLQRMRREGEKGDGPVFTREEAEKAYQDAQAFVARIR